ncbi:MAG: hypothetical protein IKE30_08750 [Clostridia bacterium]|nr:hypothetical protein [Clostridia bacterium]
MRSKRKRMRLRSFGRHIRAAVRKRRPHGLGPRGMEEIGISKKRYLAAIPILILMIAVSTFLFQTKGVDHTYESGALLADRVAVSGAFFPEEAGAGSRLSVVCAVRAEQPAEECGVRLLLRQDGVVYHRSPLQPLTEGERTGGASRFLTLDLPRDLRGPYELCLECEQEQFLLGTIRIR